jgi:hypothetical protein
MLSEFVPTTLETLPGIGEVVYIDAADENGNKTDHLDNGTLAENPENSGDIRIAPERLGMRLGGHPVHSIIEVFVSTREATTFLLVNRNGSKYLLRGKGRG